MKPIRPGDLSDEQRALDEHFLVSFHSKVMPLFRGDIIFTGTPGAVVIAEGDVVECRIPGVGALSNPVISGKAP